ncbi:MAG TPA: TPM domain-containing protein [Steroidobacteraceae bacterium]|nr:TPM domain-containing protein [Steroidobacteraceae bacterium]
MDWKRLFRHLFATRADVQRAFPPATLSEIEAAIAQAEQSHFGEIRIAIEAGLDPVHAWRGRTPRDRALEVFARLGVWDTAANNGVLIYVLLADRAVDIVADRGYEGRVSSEEWAAACRGMESSFGRGEYRQGMLNGLHHVGGIVARHFPVAAGQRNPDELPNRPVVL